MVINKKSHFIRVFTEPQRPQTREQAITAYPATAALSHDDLDTLLADFAQPPTAPAALSALINRWYDTIDIATLPETTEPTTHPTREPAHS